MRKSDLYNQYQQYTTNDLLKIIREAGDYRPEAVTIAKEILLQRGVTDIDEATAIFTAVEAIQRRSSKKKEITLKPVTNLPEWGYFLFAAIVLLSLYTLYVTTISVN